MDHGFVNNGNLKSMEVWIVALQAMAISAILSVIFIESTDINKKCPSEDKIRRQLIKKHCT